LVRQDTVVGILCRELRHADAERPALFHAPEDEVSLLQNSYGQKIRKNKGMQKGF
jgi:hypothetical protein